ncbi:glycine betaine/proline transport system substrate-binding protein [Tessaracoccus bendigoensis DSM 12906]|uniref:Glycine betaine/proline transport system substrate-binding protein n=1 Tax=Tessaracoccus bendigoensis DSM 12906 TaxID=1123357 RepID=A0A1M6MD70_9ACTN|nr:glycine betaine ABC transporter substrate-binding protein [Tessaracoccus bendigoensis]SHJ81391.1 glycine betaine/proline transport system substrate-binding protein [Tessaracoccus bendigoensis DSM 12906]
MLKKPIVKLIAGLTVAGAALVGCSGGGSSSDSITLGVFNGWDEGIATSELWKAVLEDKGYEVNLSYVDAAPLFAGLSDGDLDFTTDVWLPTTHASYVDQFGDGMEDLGVWFDSAKLTLAVNEDAPITSISELGDNASLFGNQIIGIEPGAGLTSAVEDAVIPGYGLEDMTFTTSSTAAMLTELKAATDAGENVVVTLWEPHWAYSAFPIRNLEDPEGALGASESIHIYSRTGFAEDHAEVAGWLRNFEMAPELLYDLEDLLFNQNDGEEYGPLVRQWIGENQEFVDSMTTAAS